MAEVITQIESYDEAVLKRGQKFAMRLGAYWVFGIVTDYEDIGPFVYDRFLDLATLDGEAEILGGDAQSYNILYDGGNRNILWEKDTGHVMHTFIGVDPPDLRAWYRYPAPHVKGNLSEIKMTGFNQEAKGYIDGLESGSPFEIPTTRFELMIPKELEIDIGLYNPLTITVRPLLNIFIRRYKVFFYDDKKDVDGRIIQKIINGTLAARWWSPHVASFEYDINDKLGIEGTEIEWRGR